MDEIPPGVKVKTATSLTGYFHLGKGKGKEQVGIINMHPTKCAEGGSTMGLAGGPSCGPVVYPCMRYHLRIKIYCAPFIAPPHAQAGS